MKLHHTKYKNNYKNYILDRIDMIDIEGTNQDKAKYLLDRILSEKGYQIKRGVNPQQIIADWLQGLAIDIPYNSNEMISLAVDMGSIGPDYSKREEYRILDNYWLFMANIILWVIKSEGLSINELYGWE